MADIKSKPQPALDRNSWPASLEYADTALLVHIKANFNEIKGSYGWPRIWREFLARGVRAGKECVRKPMKAHCLQARDKRKFKATMNGSHRLPVPPNLLSPHQIASGRATSLICRYHRRLPPCPGDYPDAPLPETGPR